MIVDDAIQAFAKTKFAQQRLPAWRPITTPKTAVIILAIVASISIITGPLFIHYAQSVIKIEKRYDDICKDKKICEVTLDVPSTMKGNILFEYKLTNFHQNHRKFLDSKVDTQLAGDYVDYSGMTTCGNLRSVNGSSSPENWYLPCGLAPMTFFNDTYKFDSPYDSLFSEDGIAFESDKESYQPLSSKYEQGVRWLESYTDFPNGQTNEHFIVWMTVSALPTLYKIYAICTDCTIPPGGFNVTIQNNYYDFGGTKSVVLVHSSIVGSDNVFVGAAYSAFAFCSLLMLIYVVIDRSYKPRKLGDMELIAKLIKQKNEAILARTVHVPLTERDFKEVTRRVSTFTHKIYAADETDEENDQYENRDPLQNDEDSSGESVPIAQSESESQPFQP